MTLRCCLKQGSLNRSVHASPVAPAGALLSHGTAPHIVVTQQQWQQCCCGACVLQTLDACRGQSSLLQQQQACMHPSQLLRSTHKPHVHTPLCTSLLSFPPSFPPSDRLMKQQTRR